MCRCDVKCVEEARSLLGPVPEGEGAFKGEESKPVILSAPPLSPFKRKGPAKSFWLKREEVPTETIAAAVPKRARTRGAFFRGEPKAGARPGPLGHVHVKVEATQDGMDGSRIAAPPSSQILQQLLRSADSKSRQEMLRGLALLRKVPTLPPKKRLKVQQAAIPQQILTIVSTIRS